MIDSIYEKVEKLYMEKQIYFKEVEEIFFSDFQIEHHIIRDTMKWMLVESFNNGKKKHLINYKNSIKSSILYYSTMGHFFVMHFIGKKQENSNFFDIIFENWVGNNFKGFYQKIYETMMQKYHIGIFDISEKLNISNFPEKSAVIYKNSNRSHIYDRTISYLIFKKQFFRYEKYLKLSSASQVDILNIVLRLQRYIAVYTSDSIGIYSKFLISAGDNYYNALRYYIYKKNGIDNILLIQNGTRTGYIANTSGDMYTYCDYYLGFGMETINVQKGMHCNNKLSVGSMKLYNNTIFLNKNVATVYDILFIEQLSLKKTAGFDKNIYIEIIDMLCRFSIENKDFTIVYKTKPNRKSTYINNEEMLKHIYIIDNKLTEANIIIDENISNNSYEAIFKSNVIVYYTSTMGIESLGLNKKILCCNFNKKIFQISIENEIGCLVNNSYELFENKLKYLLYNDNDEIKNYYLDKKNLYMNLTKNPIEYITEIVDSYMKEDEKCH